MFKKMEGKFLAIFMSLSVYASWVSQSLLDLSLFLMFLMLVASCFESGGPTKVFCNRTMNKIFPIFAGYFIVACLGYAFNARPQAEVYYNLSRFSWIIIIYILTWSLERAEFSFSTVRNFFLALVIPALYGFNIYFFDGVDRISGAQTGFRIVGLVNSATYHAHIGGFFAVLGLGLLFADYSKGQKLKSYFQKLNRTHYLVVLCTSVVLASVIFCKTRGALLSAFGAIAFLFLMLFGRRFATVLISLAAAAVLMVFLTPLKTLVFRSGSDDCRWKLVQVHLEMVKDYPILGIGYRDNMRNISDFWPANLADPQCDAQRLEGSQAHNQYLNVAATTGMAGFLFYLIFIGYFFVMNWRWYQITKSMNALICLSLQVYFALSCMTEITFEFAKIRHLLLCVWALVAVEVERSIKKSAADSIG